LTSISTEERPLGFDDDRLIRAAGIRKERLNDLVIGDLCGIVIPRPNLDSQSKSEIENIMARWTGARVEHLEACATRAQKGAPGVIVLAIGANKASVVHEGLRRGFSTCSWMRIWLTVSGKSVRCLLAAPNCDRLINILLLANKVSGST
jgi:hypothetical protein